MSIGGVLVKTSCTHLGGSIKLPRRTKPALARIAIQIIRPTIIYLGPLRDSRRRLQKYPLPPDSVLVRHIHLHPAVIPLIWIAHPRGRPHHTCGDPHGAQRRHEEYRESRAAGMAVGHHGERIVDARREASHEDDGLVGPTQDRPEAGVDQLHDFLDLLWGRCCRFDRPPSLRFHLGPTGNAVGRSFVPFQSVPQRIEQQRTMVRSWLIRHGVRHDVLRVNRAGDVIRPRIKDLRLEGVVQRLIQDAVGEAVEIRALHRNPGNQRQRRTFGAPFIRFEDGVGVDESQRPGSGHIVRHQVIPQIILHVRPRLVVHFVIAIVSVLAHPSAVGGVADTMLRRNTTGSASGRMERCGGRVGGDRRCDGGGGHDEGRCHYKLSK
mmetsp:Transcript_24700/g.59549  ORF Transcript_24700/g.59549 Transcript_24700/m.59549 type:complete len:379 (-) Transcript_24700:157-1293(-)